MSREQGQRIADEVGCLSSRIHAATARQARLAAELDDDGRWAEWGMRSCAHWLSIHIGVDLDTAGELIRVGHALQVLPSIAAAFAEGRLSMDKVSALVKVATPEDEPMWLDLALHASGAQLTRICRAVRRALEAADPSLAEDAMAKRSVRTWWRNDGTLELFALLPREDAAAVMAAIDAAAGDLVRERAQLPPRDDPAAREIGRLPQDALRADALVRICETWVAAGSATPTPAPTRQVVVHVDAAALRNAAANTETAAGDRCHIEDGPWLSPASLEWLSCDADVVAVYERGGLPIDVGRVTRRIGAKQRLALWARDQGCCYPGCGVPARSTEGHHIRHWPRGGRTDLVNLGSLCRFHHHRLHDGHFTMQRLPGGELRFTAADGTELLPVTPMRADGRLDVDAAITPDTVLALSGGEACDFVYAVGVLADAAAKARATAASRGP
ncbi:MAG: DUF222 domain-containing protein [Chloroflexi bacterium]|nr:MAG: DUF222 domain-containing protein [Chloroflexota bacterium]